MTTNNGQLQTVYYPTEKLIFAEYNPRQLTKDQYKALRDSIERFGLVDPIIVNKHKDRKNIVVGGHQRIRIAQDLGIKDIPCVEVELDADREKELNVRLNRNTGEWDWDALANCFDVGELLEWGFTEDELQFWVDEPTEGLIEDDEIPEVEEAITQAGDLWLLGEHRVLCGDATKKEDAERLMDGQKADMVFTDPPFPNNSGIMEDMITDIDIAFKNSRTFCKNLMIWFWDNISFPNFEEMITSKLIWHKTNGWQSGHYESMYLYHNDNKRHEQLVFNANSVGGNNKRETQGFHQTPKPIELILSVFDKLKFNNIVLDPFLGSGSTLIACEKTGRKCYGMEIDPHYCDVIVKRWEEYTGKKAERVEAASA